MDLKAISIFQIDPANSTIIHVDKATYGEDFDSYLNGLIDIIFSGNGRSFKFDRETTEIRSLISKITLDHDFQALAEVAAKRLLNCEQIVQKKIDKLDKQIQKGIIVQALLQKNDVLRYVICKAEHSEFLKDEDYKKTKGLPIKKKIYKAFAASFLKDDSISSVFVYDTNSSISKYWWRDYLELEEAYTDEYNTETAFDAIDKVALTKIKKVYPQDYIHLRNSLVRFFRANSSFNMDDYIDNGIGDYEPFDQKLDVDALKYNIKNLAKTHKFDESFEIIKKKIKARFLNTISLTPQIDLQFKEDINNLEQVVFAVEDPDGSKFVKIRSDNGYKYFKERSRQL